MKWKKTVKKNQQSQKRKAKEIVTEEESQALHINGANEKLSFE